MSTYDKNSASTFIQQLELHQEVIPLLFEACSNHPVFLESNKKKRTILLFLKTKKIRNMNDDGCDHLQQAWEEVQCFNFNLQNNIVKNFLEVGRMEESIITKDCFRAPTKSFEEKDIGHYSKSSKTEKRDGDKKKALSNWI
ncbi:hypothetical protein V8G54_028218 [Vigna mungo]|uniref:Uncharacterized protein n=1 Tax=Vigna mungo TaxID=3915 RepID=A0AAQ3MRT3_VIGMU